MSEYQVAVTDLQNGHVELVIVQADSYRDAALTAAETPESLWEAE